MGDEGLDIRACWPQAYVIPEMDRGCSLLSRLRMRVIGRVQHRVEGHNFQTP